MMRKLRNWKVVLFGTLTLGLVLSASTAQAVVDDFENRSLGRIDGTASDPGNPSGTWYASGDFYDHPVTADPDLGHSTQSLEVFPLSGTQASARFDLDTPLAGELVIIEADVYVTDARGRLIMDIRGFNSYGDDRAAGRATWGIRSGGTEDKFLMAQDAPAEQEIDFDWHANQWQTARFEFDLANQQYDFFIDGALVVADQFNSNADMANVNGIDFELGGRTADTSQPGTNVWIDNINAEVIPEPGTVVVLGAGLMALRLRRKK